MGTPVVLTPGIFNLARGAVPPGKESGGADTGDPAILRMAKSLSITRSSSPQPSSSSVSFQPLPLWSLVGGMIMEAMVLVVGGTTGADRVADSGIEEVGAGAGVADEEDDIIHDEKYPVDEDEAAVVAVDVAVGCFGTKMGGAGALTGGGGMLDDSAAPVAVDDEPGSGASGRCDNRSDSCRNTNNKSSMMEKADFRTAADGSTKHGATAGTTCEAIPAGEKCCFTAKVASSAARRHGLMGSFIPRDKAGSKSFDRVISVRCGANLAKNDTTCCRILSSVSDCNRTK